MNINNLKDAPDEHKKIMNKLSNNEQDIKLINYHNGSGDIIVVSDYKGYSTDFPNTIAKSVADVSENTVGLDVQSSKDTFDGRKIMVFNLNPDSIKSVYYMYLLACGVSIYIASDIYDQISSECKYEDVANEIERFDIDKDFQTTQDILEYMNASNDKSDDGGSFI